MFCLCEAGGLWYVPDLTGSSGFVLVEVVILIANLSFTNAKQYWSGFWPGKQGRKRWRATRWPNPVLDGCRQRDVLGNNGGNSVGE